MADSMMSTNPMDISKGVFITEILQDISNISNFRAWRMSGSALANSVSEAWDASFNITMGSPFVEALITGLVPSVLSQGALDRYNAKKTILLAQLSGDVYGVIVRTYDMTTVSGDWDQWIQEHITPRGMSYTIDGVANTVATLGILPLKEIK